MLYKLNPGVGSAGYNNQIALHDNGYKIINDVDTGLFIELDSLKALNSISKLLREGVFISYNRIHKMYEISL